MEFTHTAKPVRVNARRIKKILEIGYLLEDDSEYHAPFGSEARYIPVEGDYVVTQEDGYQYFNPKDVFERKYSAVADLKAAAKQCDPDASPWRCTNCFSDQGPCTA